MELRLIEVILPREEIQALEEFLEQEYSLGIWTDFLGEQHALVRILTSTGQTESITDRLTTRYEHTEGFRLMLFPIEATIPVPEEITEEAEEQAETEEKKEKQPERISREELYQDVASGARLTWIYMITVCLSTVVAAIGLMRNDMAVIIGAMVIAPLLGPNVSLALGSTLGDVRLVVQSAKTLLAGLGLGLLLSVFIGIGFQLDPNIPAIAGRTQVSAGDIVLALAAGSAGTLAYTSGIPAAVIGVMVAVALLPPLVIAGLLLGAGYGTRATGAGLLVLVNIASINLSGVVTFLTQHIRPRQWWEADKATTATRYAMLLRTGALVLIVVLIMLTGGII